MFELLGNSTNILSNSNQTIKLVRPQQNIQKINPSVPPLSPRVTQSINSTNQPNQVKFMVFNFLLFYYV